ncbi:hypothetical protein [Borreliella bavariensis]|uniref:hypothetical protein n=1 Tax=Borreliella bavariensis TaxID=664662 RepID=UPI002D807376|nr:hypothetical protein [Borreliella bavariensis]
MRRIKMFSNSSKKITLLKEDLRGAINANKLKEKFLNLQKLSLLIIINDSGANTRVL